MNVKVSNEVEQKLTTLAGEVGRDVADFGGSLLEEAMREKGILSNFNGYEIEDPNALARAISAMISRTPEEIKAAQRRAIAEFRPENELPPGQTIFDAVCGKWPGDETDEEVFEALERLS